MTKRMVEDEGNSKAVGRRLGLGRSFILSLWDVLDSNAHMSSRSIRPRLYLSFCLVFFFLLCVSRIVDS